MKQSTIDKIAKNLPPAKVSTTAQAKKLLEKMVDEGCAVYVDFVDLVSTVGGFRIDENRIMYCNIWPEGHQHTHAFPYTELRIHYGRDLEVIYKGRRQAYFAPLPEWPELDDAAENYRDWLSFVKTDQPNYNHFMDDLFNQLKESKNANSTKNKRRLAQ